MKIKVIKFRYQRTHVKAKQRVWVKEHKAYHYEIAESVVKFIETWTTNRDNSEFQSDS
jgi:hypothetical protein